MGINAEYMGTSVRSSPSIVVRELQVKPPKSQWLSLVLRRRRLTPSTSPSTSMTSREMARLTPSTPATSSVPATLTKLPTAFLSNFSNLGGGVGEAEKKGNFEKNEEKCQK